MPRAVKNKCEFLDNGTVAIEMKGDGGRCLVDADDYPLVENLNWYSRGGKRGGSYATAFTHAAQGRKCVLMHRIILGAKPGEFVDHINNDPLDNRRANIRICTQSENAQRKVIPVRSSGFLGVEKQGDSYRARVTKSRKIVFSKNFPSAREAAENYDRVVTETYGPLARTNKSVGLLGAATDE